MRYHAALAVSTIVVSHLSVNRMVGDMGLIIECVILARSDLRQVDGDLAHGLEQDDRGKGSDDCDGCVLYLLRYELTDVLWVEACGGSWCLNRRFDVRGLDHLYLNRVLLKHDVPFGVLV